MDTPGQSLKEELVHIEEAWDKIRQESPGIPDTLWKSVEQRYIFDDHEKKYPNFGENAQDN